LIGSAILSRSSAGITHSGAGLPVFFFTQQRWLSKALEMNTNTLVIHEFSAHIAFIGEDVPPDHHRQGGSEFVHPQPQAVHQQLSYCN
jgi:hypothetical protein